MIGTDDQLHTTRAALADLEASLADLHRPSDEVHPDRLALMAEPVLEHIYRLRAEFDDYLGITAVAKKLGRVGAPKKVA